MLREILIRLAGIWPRWITPIVIYKIGNTYCCILDESQPILRHMSAFWLRGDDLPMQRYDVRSGERLR
jgi:hypothetical protein